MTKREKKSRISYMVNNLKKITGIGTTFEDEEFAKEVDLKFVNIISPKTGISFADEKYVSTGVGYEACLYVYGYKHEIDLHWLFHLIKQNNTITTIDVASINSSEVKRNLSKTMEEHRARQNTAKSSSQYIDASKQFNETEAMYREVSEYGNIMKAILIRIYVPQRNLVDCDKALSEITSQLEGEGYKLGVCLNETKEEFTNSVCSYKQQQNKIFGKKGQSILSTTLSIGNPNHYTFLNDPLGFYYGSTDTNGSVILDRFNRTGRRNSYNSVIVGKMGSGKSTLLKKEFLERAIRGDLIRVFDVTGEFRTLCDYLGGRVISLSGGNDGIINALQILSSGDNDRHSYVAHMSKVATVYRYLKPDATTEEVLVLKKMLKILYIQKGIIDSNGRLLKNLNDFRSEDFPIWQDLHILCKNAMNKNLVQIDIETTTKEDDELEEVEKKINFTNLSHLAMQYIENIELQIGDIVSQYGDIFNGHTSLTDFSKEQIVVFDLSNITSLEATIFDAQIFQALTLCWDNCVKVGKEMKELYDRKAIKDEDIKHFLILIDEAHRIVNAKKITGVDQITQFAREARKYFGGIDLASQSIRDFVPDNSESIAVDKLKTLFELSTYKWVMNQDSNCKSKLREIFNGEFTDNEVEQVPELLKGETLLSVGGEKTLKFHIDVSDEELSLFAGGA